MLWLNCRQGLPRGTGFWLCCICTVFLVVCHGSANPVSADEEEHSRRQQMLWDFIPRDRRLRETLSAVHQLRPQTRSSDAIKLAQWILDQPFDAFVLTPNRQLLSVRGAAESRIRSFPADWRQEYERTLGLEARQLFEDAVQRDDERLAIEVLRRFRLTTAADDAAIWLAQRWLDHGEISLALAALVPFDAAEGSLETISVTRLSSALPLAIATGHSRLASVLQAELEARQIFPIPSPQNLTEKSRHRTETLSPVETIEAGVWDQGNLPVLRPRWTASLISVSHQKTLLPLFDSWRSQLQAVNQLPVAIHRPLVVRNQLVTRTDSGITGFDFVSGKRAWTYPCETSLETFLREVSGTHQRGGPPPELLQSWIGGNSQLGFLSSDGVRIYFVDSIAFNGSGGANRADAFQQSKSPEAATSDEFNRLVALALPAVSAGKISMPPKVAWNFGSTAATNGKGRFFFGPPVAQAGRLFSIVEINREIRLLALQAETGATLWEQPLAAVDRSVLQDGERAFTACLPVLAGDLILCPTGAGVLAAVDAITGALRWSYFDGDLPSEPNHRLRSTIVSRGREGFAPVTVVHNEQILHLPVNSSYLHILQRETGQLIRTIPRQRACSLAAVTNDLAVLVESRACRAIRLADGTDVWRKELPSISGTGVVLGSELLIPLEQGRCARLELTTGRETTWQPTRNGLSLGNLTVCGQDVVSQTPEGVTVFPQANFVERLLKDSKTTMNADDRRRLTAEWELTTGRLEQAETSLHAALSFPQPARQLDETRHLLRELLYARLDTSAGRSQEVISRLKELSFSAEEKGRLAARQARQALAERDAKSLKQALLDLAALPAGVTFEAVNELGWQQSCAACGRQLLTEAERTFPGFARTFREDLVKRVSADFNRPENKNLMDFALDVCRELPQAERWRDRLARESHRPHTAELLWLQNLRGDDAGLAASAAANLATLWSESGWPRDSAILLRDLLTNKQPDGLQNHQADHTRLESQPEHAEAREWLRRELAPARPIRAVSIRALVEPKLPELMPLEVMKNRQAALFRSAGAADSRLKFEPIEPMSTEISWQLQGEHSLLSVVEKATAQRIYQWQLPSPISTPFTKSAACQGHYFPVGLAGEFRGYSLLELSSESPVWTQRPPALERQKSVAIVGPGGPSFITFQVQNSLFVCDPVDGKVRWQRTGLEPNCGLYADPLCGIAGDEHCLVVFGSNRTSYTVYDTMTGEQIRSSQLEAEQSQPRRTAFGRKILRIVRERSQFSLRIWDPLTDKNEVQESLSDRNNLFQPLSATEVAWITPKGTITVYDVPNSQRRMEAELPADELEKMNALRFFKNGDRLFVNVQRNTQSVQLRNPNNYYDRSAFPMSMVRDDLFAFDITSGRLLWRKTIPSRSVVRLDPPGLPFLVMLCLIRDRQDSTLESLLVEVLDANTGEVLGRQDNLPPDQLVHVNYDGVDRTVTLQGLKSRIQIVWQHGQPDRGE